jgi:hypothetical protein
MPLTFFAHQALLLPASRRRWARMDALALMIGTMSPDFAYVVEGTPLEIFAHKLPVMTAFCVPATVIVCWIVARVIAPVVPDHLPRLGAFQLHDYRGLARWKFRLAATPLSAFVGAASHVFIDSFTHGWGFVAQQVPWYMDTLGTWSGFGRPWTPFRIVQYIGHVVLTLWAIWTLRRYGKARWLQAAANQVPSTSPTTRSHVLVWTVPIVSTLTAAALTLNAQLAVSTGVIRVSAVAFVSLTVAALLARSSVAPPR